MELPEKAHEEFWRSLRKSPQEQGRESGFAPRHSSGLR